MTIYRLFSDIFILACLAGRKQFSSFQGMPTYFSMHFSRSSCAEWEKLPPEQRKKAHEEERAKWREERMKNMTPEEKERFEQREKQREEWRKMTPEERQKAREEARAKWDSMSDAEKDAAREHFRSYYHAGGGHYYEGHRKYRHHKGEYRGEHRGGYYGDGRTECPNSNCPW